MDTKQRNDKFRRVIENVFGKTEISSRRSSFTVKTETAESPSRRLSTVIAALHQNQLTFKSIDINDMYSFTVKF